MAGVVSRHQTRDSHVVPLIECHICRFADYCHIMVVCPLCFPKEYTHECYSLYGLYMMSGGWQSDVKRASTLFQHSGRQRFCPVGRTVHV